MNKVYGDPRITIRLPEEVIDGLKQMADDQNTTLSNILRELAMDVLKQAGYSFESKGAKKARKTHKKSP